MKIISIVFIFALVNLFAVNHTPSWYPNEENSITSYGSGITYEEAKKNAFDNFITNNKELDKTIITDIEVIKEEIFENRFFLEIQYNKNTITEQLKKEMKNIVFKLEDETNKYLLSTKLMKDLNKIYGYTPDINISKKNIYFNNKVFIVKNNEFHNFLFEHYSDDILLDIKMELVENEKYFIKITPKVDGFTSLVQVYNNTNVEVLFSNQKFTSNVDTLFPNFKMSDGLEISLYNNENSKEIVTLAIVCPDKNEFTKFNNIFLSSITNENMVGELIDSIGNCEFTSIFTVIKKQ